MTDAATKRSNRLVAAVGLGVFVLCELIALGAVLKALNEENFPVAIAFGVGALLGLGALGFFVVAVKRGGRDGRL
jgi:hypothetical protein